MTERTIPLLPCRDIQPIADFYTALGFEVTLLQRSPYPYVVVERGDVELQFLGMKGYNPDESISGCYVLTDEVDAMYEAFRAGLRAAYGRVPQSGVPRIGPLKDMSYGVRQFVVADPSNNDIRVGQPLGDGDGHHQPPPKDTFERALHFGVLFADSKLDLPAAAKVVDRALALHSEKPTRAQFLRLLVLRGDIAERMGEREEARRLLRQAGELPLSDAEREGVSDDLRRLGELRELVEEE